jgi:hypothetical protein
VTRASSKQSLTVIFALLLGACAPGHYLIERADVSGIEERLDLLASRFAEFERQQAEAHAQLSLEQRYSAAALMQTMLEESLRITCKPVPQCQDAGPDDDAARAAVSAPTRKVYELGGKQVIGAVEKVLLTPPGMPFEARVDTGAESSSLDARDIQEFERDGARWVRFSIFDRESGEFIEIERRIVRHVRILQSLTDRPERRPVVRMQLTLGESTQNAEFTLSDRSHLNFSVLIGRNVLQDIMLVDVSRKNIAPPAISTPD